MQCAQCDSARYDLGMARPTPPERKVPASWLAAALDVTKVTNTALAERLDVTQTTVSRLANGHAPLSEQRWGEIRAALHELPADWMPPSDPARPAPAVTPRTSGTAQPSASPSMVRLAGRMTVDEAKSAQLALAPQLWLPLYDLAAMAGGFSLSMSPAVEALLCIEGLRGSVDANVFVSRVSGRSMMPVLRDGDMVVWRRDDAPQSGDIVLAQLHEAGDAGDGGGYTVKQLRLEGTRARLVPLNEAFDAIEVPQEAGRVVVLARLLAIIDPGEP